MENTEDRFKVTTNSGGTVNAGEQPKGQPSPLGLTREAAEADANRRNESAENLGIQTRYEVRPL